MKVLQFEKLCEITYFTIEIRNLEGNNNYAAFVIVLNIRHRVKPYSRRNKVLQKKYYHTGSEKKTGPGRSSSQPASFSYCLALSWKEDPALNEDSLLTC